MSWEEAGKYEEKCPCGKGKIITIWYDDDWNRSKSNRIIECEYCKTHYQWISIFNGREYREVIVTNEEAERIRQREREEQQKREEERRIRDHENYAANLKSFNRSLKLAGGSVVIKRGDLILDSNRFLELPLEIQEYALGSAKGRSPYCKVVLYRIPDKYWEQTSD